MSVVIPAEVFKLDQIQRTAIERALRAAGGNRERAAKMLGIARSTLFERIKRHGIKVAHSRQKTT